MISISPAEQAAFQSSYPKTLTLNFPLSDPLTNEDIYLESAQLEQSICEENNLTFGMVYSSHFSVRIFDNGISYTGVRINPRISVDVEGTTYERSLGGYTVKSDKLTSDKLYRDLECYDYLTDVLPVDFHEWHNNQPDTFTIKQYRDAFFSYIEIEQESINLPNDDIFLNKFTVTELSGANIISSILQLTGAFGFLASNGKFKYVLPKMEQDYLIDDNSYVQGSLTYEDEPIRQISGVKIIGYSDDYGEEGSYTVPDVSAGIDTNSVFTIEDNYLIHACDELHRQRLCDNLYLNLRDFMYYPASVDIPPYIGMEPGDVFKIETERKNIFFPVLKRTLKGISALMDSIEANGEPDSRTNINSIGGGVSSVQLVVNQVRESVAELLAGKASIAAQDAAIAANIAANNALTQLGIIEDVSGTLRWISEHGTYVLTEDITVDVDTVYFELINGEYIPIAQPDKSANPLEEGWYVLDVTDSQSDYIMKHLAVTSAGLWVLPNNRLAPHQVVDSDGNVLIDSDENPIVDFSIDPQNAIGYKVLLSNTGMTVYNNAGAAVANYGETTTVGAVSGYNVYIDGTAVKIRNGTTVLTSYGSSADFYIPGTDTVASSLGVDGLSIIQGRIGNWKVYYGGLSTESTTTSGYYYSYLADTGFTVGRGASKSQGLSNRIDLSSYPTAKIQIKNDPAALYLDTDGIEIYPDIYTGTSYLKMKPTSIEAMTVNGYYTIYPYGVIELTRSGGASYVSVETGVYKIALDSTTSGTRGVYDSGTASWIFYKNSSNNAYFNGQASSVSDLKRKSVITDYDWKVDDFIRGLKPIAFYRKAEDGTLGDRIHYGFGAQDVKALADKTGLENLGVYHAKRIGTDEEGNKAELDYHGEKVSDDELSWSLVYEELIAPMVLEIQRLMHRVDELEARLNG